VIRTAVATKFVGNYDQMPWCEVPLYHIVGESMLLPRNECNLEDGPEIGTSNLLPDRPSLFLVFRFSKAVSEDGRGGATIENPCEEVRLLVGSKTKAVNLFQDIPPLLFGLGLVVAIGERFDDDRIKGQCGRRDFFMNRGFACGGAFVVEKNSG
jgi:hypothetical protein